MIDAGVASAVRIYSAGGQPLGSCSAAFAVAVLRLTPLRPTPTAADEKREI
jgi:hypothetical protein